MSTINLISLITLGLVLIIGFTVWYFVRKYLRDIDGVIGIYSQEQKENELANSHCGTER